MEIVVIDDKGIIESHNDLELEQVIKRLDLIPVSYTHLTLPTNREV